MDGNVQSVIIKTNLLLKEYGMASKNKYWKGMDELQETQSFQASKSVEFPEQNNLESILADDELKRVGKKLRFQFDVIKKLNKKITPKEIIKLRKQFRTSVIVRNIYSEVLNIIQPIVISKLKKSKTVKEKKYLNDALMTSIAGISAAMKNTG